jgi:hypothetical protein
MFFSTHTPGVLPLAVGFVPVGDREKQWQNLFEQALVAYPKINTNML